MLIWELSRSMGNLLTDEKFPDFCFQPSENIGHAFAKILHKPVKNNDGNSSQQLFWLTSIVK